MNVRVNCDPDAPPNKGMQRTRNQQASYHQSFVRAAEGHRSVLLLNQFYGKLSAIMSTAKQEVESLLSKLPDDCSLEDIQYHLHVIETVRNGLKAADSQGAVPQEEVERRLGKWLTE